MFNWIIFGQSHQFNIQVETYFNINMIIYLCVTGTFPFSSSKVNGKPKILEVILLRTSSNTVNLNYKCNAEIFTVLFLYKLLHCQFIR